MSGATAYAKLSDLGQHAGQVKEVFLGKFIYLRIRAVGLKQTREFMRVENSLPVRFDRKQSLYPEDRCIPDASCDGQDLMPPPCGIDYG